MTEAVQIDRKSKLFSRPALNGVVDCAVVHRSPLARRPQTVVLGGTGDHITEFGQIPVDAR
jgi:hypothetical protein